MDAAQQCTPRDSIEEIRSLWSEEDSGEEDDNEDEDWTVDRQSKRHRRVPSSNVNGSHRDVERYSSPNDTTMLSDLPLHASVSEQWLFRNETPILHQQQASKNQLGEIDNSTGIKKTAESTMILRGHLVSNPGEAVESLTHDVADWSLTRDRRRTRETIRTTPSSTMNDPQTTSVADDEKTRKEQKQHHKKQQQQRRYQSQNAKRQIFKAFLSKKKNR